MYIQALDILKQHQPWCCLSNCVQHVRDHSAPVLVVLDTSSEATAGEWLAWKARGIDVNRRNITQSACGHVIEPELRAEVLKVDVLAAPVSVAPKLQVVAKADVLKGLFKGAAARAISPNSWP